MLTLETILKDSVWVAKVGGCRYVGTYDEVERWYDDEDWRDTDLCCEQPEHLREFYDAYFKYSEKHGFTIIQDFYNNVYAKRRVWTEAEIKELVQTNDTVLYRALKKLYDCQTEGELVSKDTHEANGAGFNKIDAGFMTSVCEFLIKNGFLTSKQKAVVRKKIIKYTKQLTRIANAA